MGNADSTPESVKDVFHDMAKGSQPTTEQLEAIWDSYDKDKNGELDIKEISSLQVGRFLRGEIRGVSMGFVQH